MLEFFKNNLGSIAVLTVVVIFVAFLIYVLVKNKKKGGSSCGGGCAGCPMSGKCSGHK